MGAYSELQQAEFSSENNGYTATRHQREVGTGYFDSVTQVITGGSSSVTALTGSTEEEQFDKYLLVPVKLYLPVSSFFLELGMYNWLKK